MEAQRWALSAVKSNEKPKAKACEPPPSLITAGGREPEQAVRATVEHRKRSCGLASNMLDGASRNNRLKFKTNGERARCAVQT